MSAIKASITLPKDLERELKELAIEEYRTLSGVIQEAARYYLQVRKWEQLQRNMAPYAAKLRLASDADVDKLIHKLRRK